MIEARVKTAKALLDFGLEIASSDSVEPHIGIFITTDLPRDTMIAACANVLEMNYILLGDNNYNRPCIVHAIGNENDWDLERLLSDPARDILRGSVVVVPHNGPVEAIIDHIKINVTILRYT